MSYRIIADYCIGCGACQTECPTMAITETESKGETVFMINPEKCIECIDTDKQIRCAVACPTEAVEYDPAHKDTKDTLLGRWHRLHPDVKLPEPNIPDEVQDKRMIANDSPTEKLEYIIPWNEAYDRICSLFVSSNDRQKCNNNIRIKCSSCEIMFSFAQLIDIGAMTSFGSLMGFSRGPVDNALVALSRKKPNSWSCPYCNSESITFKWLGSDKEDQLHFRLQLNKEQERKRVTVKEDISHIPHPDRLAWAFVFGFDHMPSSQEVNEIATYDPDLHDVTISTGMIPGPPPKPEHGLEALAFTMAKAWGRDKLHHEIDLAKVTFQIVQGFLVIRIRQ